MQAAIISGAISKLAEIAFFMREKMGALGCIFGFAASQSTQNGPVPGSHFPGKGWEWP
jgi:hypothetical protein